MESQFFQDMPTNMMGFSFFHQYGFTKEEMKPLIERLLGKNNPEDWSAGVELAAQYGDDAFTARLIAIATTPGINARLTAISALAYNRTDDGVKTLKTLLNDPDPKIWWPLGAAIQNGYYRGIQPAGRPLRPEDFTAKDLEPLIERLMNDTNHDPVLGISLAAEFSDDDTFTQRLIGIAKTRGNTGRVNAIYALALNRTAEGLKTLNELLNDPDPEIRTMTENAIRYAYTSHGNSRGRPLKPEDFDAKYRQPEPGKSNL
jgi:HEAT repeat protein